MRSLRRLLRIHEGEGGRTLLLLAQNFCVVAITIAGKSARDTFFLSRFDKSYLPLMYVACAVVVALAAAVFARAARRGSPAAMPERQLRAVRRRRAAAGARARARGVPALYVWVEIVVALSALQFWLMASDVFDPRQAKRLFGVVGGGGSLASIAVGTAVRPFVGAFGPAALLWFVAAAIGAYWALGHAALRRANVRRRPPGGDRHARRPARLDTYLWTITLIIGLSAVVSQVIDYQFKIIASRSFAGEAELAGFFGHFYAVVGVASLVIQFLLTSRILARFGLAAGLMVLPVCLNVGTLAVLIRPQLWSGTLSKFADQSIKHTLNSSALELLWLPVPADRRSVMRPAISGTYKSVSEAGAGIVTYALVKVVALRYLGLVSLLALLGWVAAVRRVKGLYVRALVAAIEGRRIDVEDLVIDGQDAAMVAVIDRALDGGDEVRQRFVLDLIDGLARALGRDAAAARGARPRRGPRASSGWPRTSPPSWATKPSSPRCRGRARPRRKRPRGGRAPVGAGDAGAGAADWLARRERPRGRRHRRASPRSPAGRPAQAILGRLLDEPATRALAVAELADNPAVLPGAWLRAYLSDAAPDVRRAALDAVAARRDTACLPEVVVALADAAVAPAARAALRTFPADRVRDEIRRAYSAPHPAALRALADDASDEAVDMLLDAAGSAAPEIAAQAAGALQVIARRRPLTAADLRRADAAAESLVRRAYAANRLLALLPGDASALLLRDHGEDRMRGAIPTLVRLTLLRNPGEHVGTAVQIVQAADTSRLPFVLELVEGSVRRDRLELWGGLLEPLSVEARDAIALRHFPDLPRDLAAEVRRLTASGTRWERAIGLHYLRGQVPRAPTRRPTGMLSTLEKTILLKSVPLFHDIPADRLARVAQIAEATRRAAGEAIVREGEAGDALYIVVDGRIRVHKGASDLAVLAKGECVGEMALLDESPRSADVTAVEDATLLRIAQEDFVEVMSGHPAILRSILRLLARRLRDANDELASRA
ncbi:MAG: cyclic nucleotide-binding domain-containing protein [Anaerolineae bacterium]